MKEMGEVFQVENWEHSWGFKKNFLFSKYFPIIRGKIFIYFSYKGRIYHF